MAGETQTLNAICSLIVDCPHSTPVWTDSGFVVLRNQNIKKGKLDLSDPSYTDAEHFVARNRRARPSAGDIVITREAPMGEVCMIPEGLECCLGQRQVLLRPNPKVAEPRYVLYALQSESVQHQIGWNQGTGSTVSNLRIPVLEALNIPTPPIEEQRAIARILGALDDKIELNRRTTETLEAMAHTLFKSWFVDFDGVVETDLVESDVGLIPKKWESRPVGDFAELKGGKQLDKEEIAKSGSIPVFGGAGVMGYTTTHNAEGFVITVGRVGAYCGQFFAHRGKAYVNNNASLIRQIKEEHSEWLFLSLLNADIETIKKGAAQPFVSNGDIANLKIVWPGETTVQDFTKLVAPLIQRGEKANDESRALAALRDLLLPTLISGEIKVSEMETE
jgi:type I restriction enzyme S subunit